MPTKPVIQHDCERCGRSWYSETEKPSVALAVSMILNGGERLRGDFSMLCDSCEKTAENAVRTLLKAMKKNSPAKSRAKGESAVASSPQQEPEAPTASASDPMQRGPGVGTRPFPVSRAK